jgi:hypothetical protein
MAEQAGEDSDQGNCSDLGQAAHPGAMQQESQAHLLGNATGKGVLIYGPVQSAEPRLGG